MAANNEIYNVGKGLRRRLLALVQIGAVLFGVLLLFYYLQAIAPVQQ